MSATLFALLWSLNYCATKSSFDNYVKKSRKEQAKAKKVKKDANYEDPEPKELKPDED